MDSLTQAVLGAAVGVAVMHRRTAAWKAALWGGVAGTLPDLDVLLAHGDPILDMVLHRGWSHAPFWQTLVSVPLSWLASRLAARGGAEPRQWGRWWMALWLALVTHPLLDVLTVYGTQLGLPFTNHPYAQGSVFIIDPLVTLPWLAGLAWALAARGSVRGHKANRYGLAAGVAYLALGVALQVQVERQARASLAAAGVGVAQLLVTPAPFTVLLWRIVAIDAGGAGYLEGFHGLLDPPALVRFDRFDRGARLEGAVAGNVHVQHVRRFSKGFYKLDERDGAIVITDLRMGQEPAYTFAFAVTGAGPDHAPLDASRSVGGRGDSGALLSWWRRRVLGDVMPPPR